MKGLSSPLLVLAKPVQLDNEANLQRLFGNVVASEEDMAAGIGGTRSS